MRPFAIAIAIAIAVALASGCVQNAADLKDRLDRSSTDAETLVESVDEVERNDSAPKPPVARITIFGASNALLFKSSFVGEDVATPLLVPPAVEITLIASDSEAIATGAKLATIAWSVNGQTLIGGKATTTLADPGLYPLTLTVTDSNGLTDSQSVKLGVMPEPFDVVTQITSEAVVGAQGAGQAASIPFELSSALAGKPAAVQAFKVVAAPALSCDIVLSLLDPEGGALAEKDDGGATAADQTETIELGALAEGTYTIGLTPYACAEPQGIAVTVTVTFLEIVPGLTDGGDGGGHAH